MQGDHRPAQGRLPIIKLSALWCYVELKVNTEVHPGVWQGIEDPELSLVEEISMAGTIDGILSRRSI